MKDDEITMATKSYTSLEQSRKLAEILPIESADMRYQMRYDNKNNLKYIPVFIPTIIPLRTDILCWSLAALYGILPNNKKESTTLSRGGWKIESIEYLDNWWCEYEDESHTKDFTVSADNPVDACYEMILKLNELKML